MNPEILEILGKIQPDVPVKPPARESADCSARCANGCIDAKKKRRPRPKRKRRGRRASGTGAECTRRAHPNELKIELARYESTHSSRMLTAATAPQTACDQDKKHVSGELNPRRTNRSRTKIRRITEKLGIGQNRDETGVSFSPGRDRSGSGWARSWRTNFDVARRTFAEADDAAGFALSKLCFEGPEEELRLTTNTQPAIVTASIAALRVYRDEIGSSRKSQRAIASASTARWSLPARSSLPMRCARCASADA